MQDGTELLGDAVVLATGHSARDVYEQLARDAGVTLEPKGMALGFRVEHPQALINRISCVVLVLILVAAPSPSPRGVRSRGRSAVVVVIVAVCANGAEGARGRFATETP